MTGRHSMLIDPAPVMIAGAGIAGLTAALALLRLGVSVRVFEQAGHFGDVGAGISLSKPASRGLFSLGLREAVEAISDVPSRAGSADHRTGERLVNSEKMAPLTSPSDIPQIYQVHRADLHALLADAILAIDPSALSLKHRFVSADQDDFGVDVAFSDGAKLRGSLLIGADGINSTARRLLFGEESPSFTGQVAYRFLLSAQQAAPFMGQGPSVNYAGPDRILLRYPIRHGEVVNVVAYVRTASWTGEGWANAATVDELLGHFEGWNDDVRGLIAAAPDGEMRKWALFDREPMSSWTKGRITLMGDAAHPMLPFLGLGAAMGIEDAVVLGRAFGALGVTREVLATYEATRRSRANEVLLASRRQGQLYQAKEQPKDLNVHDYLLDYDPATAPLVMA